MDFLKGLCILPLFANIVFGLSLNSSYNSIDSIKSLNFDTNIGVIYKFDTIICKYNGKEYSGIVHKSNHFKKAIFYSIIFTDTLEIMINGKSRRLWLYRYKGMIDNDLVFRSNGFWKGKLIIRVKDIDGFWAFPKCNRFY